MTDLRDRLESAASSIDPTADLWSKVERRGRGRRRRPLVAVAVAAAAAVVAGVIAVPSLGREGHSVRVPAGGDETGVWRHLPAAPFMPSTDSVSGVWTGTELLVRDS